MAAILSRWEVTPTIPATAITLDRHPGIVKELSTLDTAIHGYRHIPYGGLSAADQARELDAARLSFVRHGLKTTGFRAPYLSANPTTLQLLRERKFAFDSSAPRFVVPDADLVASETLRLLRVRYGEVERGPLIPRAEGGLAELPVALPDDEILMDGLGIANPSTIQGVFEGMLNVAHRAGSLLVFQVHPERFHFFSAPLAKVLRRASELGAWCACLSEIAQWVLKNPADPGRWPQGRSMALAITGDLDAVSIGDFARRALGG